MAYASPVLVVNNLARVSSSIDFDEFRLPKASVAPKNLRRLTDPEKLRRRRLKYEAKYPNRGRPEGKIAHFVAVGCLNEARRKREYYVRVVAQLKRMRTDEKRVYDFYLKRDIMRAGSEAELLASLRFSVRYSIMTASDFSKKSKSKGFNIPG